MVFEKFIYGYVVFEGSQSDCPHFCSPSMGETRYKNLRKLGLKHYEAIRWANTRLGYARVANSPILSTTISNERLKRFGLVSLLDQYQLVHV
jgi:hypothetical protein